MLFFKKKKKEKDVKPTQEVKLEFKEVNIVNEPYDPWKGVSNSDSVFSNVNFLNRVSCSEVGKTNDDYPRLMSYHLDIHNPIKKHLEMIEKGYLEPAQIKDCISKLKVSELKEILLSNDIKPSGKKNDLVCAVVENIDLNTFEYPKPYVLSDKGKQFIKENQYYIDISKYIDGNITVQLFEEIKKKQPYITANDALWQIYNIFEISYPIDAYSRRRYNNLNRFLFLDKEGKKLEASKFIVIVVCYDLSGMRDNGWIANFEHLNLGLEDYFAEYKDYLNEDLIRKYYKITDLPFRYFDCDTTIKIINDVCNGCFSDLSNYKHLERPCNRI